MESSDKLFVTDETAFSWMGKNFNRPYSRIDPETAFMRRFAMMPTHVNYFVPHPHPLWHIDGHHKLIKP